MISLLNLLRRQTLYRRRQPTLRFSPTAWAKLLYLRDCGQTEVGCFGISSKTRRLLIEDVQLVRQSCTAVSVVFDDASAADFFDRQVDQGRHPRQFARIWLHTHPGNSALPSLTDEDTFDRVFGRADWSVMFILARGGQTYARLQCNGRQTDLEVGIDWNRPFPGSDFAGWEAEYLANVVELPCPFSTGPTLHEDDFRAPHAELDNFIHRKDSNAT
jgi:proteasome lid subunit RPN8/RPN11